jgi:ABC-type Mn2+/Zn2+ transport system permease subunit
MLLLCIANGAWLVGIWELFPLISVNYPYMQIELVAASGVMALAALLACFALLRGMLAFRALQHAHEQG